LVVLHVPPEDVTDADVLEIEVLGEHLGLSALATSLNPHDHEFAHDYSARRAAARGREWLAPARILPAAAWLCQPLRDLG
jgi:hypothetical protein